MNTGFKLRPPEEWNKPWLVMWFVFFIALIILSPQVDFWPDWVLLTIPLFWIPEMLGIRKEDDGFPPLTHAIRHFLPNWFAFPLIYFMLGSVGARWLEFQRPIHLGALFGLLGWLTDHFSVTYARKDPHPIQGSAVTPEDLAASVDPRPRAF